MASSAFHRAVEALERAHRLALILLVGPNDRANEAREQLDKLLPPHLDARSYRIDRQGPDILSFAESLADPFPILFVHGFERIGSERREDTEIRLNLLRDAFAQHHLGLVFWLPRDSLESFLQHCPDLFAWRSLLAEVDGSELAVSSIIAARREYLSRLLRQTRLPEVLVEIHVVTADRASLPIDFQEWAVKTERGIVVGPAGSGKTTSLRTLAHRFADHAYDDATQPVPVLLQVGAFSLASPFDADQTWPCGLDLELSPDVLSTLAETGRLILLFDGLDETPPVVQGALLDWIIRLWNRYPLLKMIMATRILDPVVLLNLFKEWEVVHMQKLTEEQAHELAYKLLALHGVDPGHRADIHVKDSSISQHPLLAQMLLSNLGSGHLRPEGQRRLALDRVRFLSDLVGRRLMDFDEVTFKYRGIGHARRADVLGYRDVLRALQRVALAMMTAGTTWISRDMLSSTFSEIPGLFSTETVRKNLEYLLISRSGLLQVQAGGLSFVHISIQEYLAAECLMALEDDKTLEILDANVTDPRWREAVTYTVALLEMDNSTGVKLLDTLADRALHIPEAGTRAASFATLLGAAVGVDVWSETLASVLRAARLMIEDSSVATYALEPVVGEAMRLHGKVD
jgi:NACHT domain-containing protein